jgi:hypothetical protein
MRDTNGDKAKRHAPKPQPKAPWPPPVPHMPHMRAPSDACHACASTQARRLPQFTPITAYKSTARSIHAAHRHKGTQARDMFAYLRSARHCAYRSRVCANRGKQGESEDAVRERGRGHGEGVSEGGSKGARARRERARQGRHRARARTEMTRAGHRVSRP